MVFQKGHKFYKGGERSWFKKGHEVRLGIKHSEETKKKISLANRGHKGYWTGKKLTEEAKRKMSKAKIGKYTGENSPSWKGGWKNKIPKCKNCGKQLKNLYAKLCYPCFSKYYKGEKHWNWQGGKSIEPYTIDWTETLKKNILKRDKYTCQLCGKLQSYEKFLIHHIDYNKKNCSPGNLITLCRSCHTKTNYNRNYWIKFFKE
jgi:hypothetical protein